MRQMLSKMMNKLKSGDCRTYLFLTACTAFIFIRIIGCSLLRSNETDLLRKLFLLITCLAVAGKVFLDILSREYKIKELCIIALISLFLVVNMRMTGIKDAFIYWFFIIGSRGTDYKRIMKWAAIAHFAALFLVIGSCYSHVIDNVVYLQGDRIRESLGFSYTSEPANFFFYAVLLWVYARDREIRYPEVLLLTIVDVFIYTKTGTNSAFALSMLVLGVALAAKRFSVIGSWRKGYCWIAALIVPCAVGFILYTTLRYDPSVAWLDKLNQLIHARLQLGHEAIGKYGIPVFGQRIRWIGGTDVHLGKYNYVDSSFIQILVNYGWVFFCLLLFALFIFERSISDHKDFYLLIVFGALILHSTFDPQLIWIMFNSFWLAYPYITETGTGKNGADSVLNKRWIIVFPAAVFGLAAASVTIPACGRYLNRALYLDDNYSGYIHQLLDARTKYVSASTDSDDAYVLAWVAKDGFGEVTPEEMLFFANSSKRMNPDIERTALCFSDGTGLEIPSAQPQKAKYGEIDAEGRVVGIAKTIDLLRPLIEQIDGVTIFDREYDEDMNLIYQFRKGADGEGIEDSNGNAGFYRTYDKRHHVISQRNIDSDKQPNVNWYGFSEIRRKYDGEDLIWEGYFNAEGRPVVLTDRLYASVSREYDKEHNCISEKYFDVNGYQTDSVGGYAEIRREYLDRRVSKESFFDTSGKAILLPEGYASRSFEYNERGVVSSETYMDVSGKPVITSFGYAEVHRTYEGFNLVKEMYFGIDGLPLMREGGFCGISQEWRDGHLLSRTYLDAEENPVERTDGYATALWQQDAEDVWNIQLADLKGKTVPLEGINLAADLKMDSEGWSAWMTPYKNVENSCINIGYVNLGNKKEGEQYTCQVEIEFRDVAVSEGWGGFRFWTQGAQDGKWTAGNVWNGALINMDTVPEDGVYQFTSTVSVNGDMVNISRFIIGFRCDYWASGSFRVRHVKIEKGSVPTEWSPGV